MNKFLPVLGVTGVGVVGGGAIWATRMLSKNEVIKNKLKEEKYEILRTSSDEHWNKILESYKKSENQWKLNNEKIESISQLKSICESSINSSYTNEIYKAITKWCVVPRTAENILGNGVSLLGVDDTKTDDQEAWKHNVDGYIATKSNTKYALSYVTFIDNQEAENTKKLKVGCKNRRNKFTYDLDLDDSIKEIKKWRLSKPT